SCVFTPRGTPTSGFLFLRPEGNSLLLVQTGDGDAQDGVAHADLVAVAQTHGPAGQTVRFRGRARGALLADPFAVDVGAVEAAQGGDADAGRVDLQQAVVPGDARVLMVRRQTDGAILAAADDDAGRSLEDKASALEAALGDAQFDPRAVH